MPKDADVPTMESIAEQLEIHRHTLYDWIREDAEFSQKLSILKDVQQNDPFKTGTSEDMRVNSMTIALILIEKRDQQHKSSDL